MDLMEFTEGTRGTYFREYNPETHRYQERPAWWTWCVGEHGVTRLELCKCGQFANAYGQDDERIFRHFCEN